MDEPKMTRDDIIRMAMEAGLSDFVIPLEHFAALVAAAEREACAKLIEDYLSVGLAKEMARIIRDH